MCVCVCVPQVGGTGAALGLPAHERYALHYINSNMMVVKKTNSKNMFMLL